MLELFPAIWNGTLREHYLLLFSVAGSIALGAGFVGAWLGARFASRRMIQELRETLPGAQQQENGAGLQYAFHVLSLMIRLSSRCAATTHRLSVHVRGRP